MASFPGARTDPAAPRLPSSRPDVPVPGAVRAGIPSCFACPAAFGDLLAASLALAALPAVLRKSPAGRPLVWVFNIEGTLDLDEAPWRLRRSIKA
jgi:hypothetical protein